MSKQRVVGACVLIGFASLAYELLHTPREEMCEKQVVKKVYDHTLTVVELESGQLVELDHRRPKVGDTLCVPSMKTIGHTS